jgi:hypothetical protein
MTPEEKLIVSIDDVYEPGMPLDQRRVKTLLAAVHDYALESRAWLVTPERLAELEAKERVCDAHMSYLAEAENGDESDEACESFTAAADALSSAREALRKLQGDR